MATTSTPPRLKRPRCSSPYFATPEPTELPPKKTTKLPGDEVVVVTPTQRQNEEEPNNNKKGALPPLLDPHIPPHTLFLGTQPSDNSLEHRGYYLTNENAFWHIVGDALGFKRGFHLKNRSDAVDFIRPHLLHDVSLDYAAACSLLTSRGYAVWDMVEASFRDGSLDSNIREATYHDVPSFVDAHPSITRICFSTGSQSADRFRKAYSDWIFKRARPRNDALSVGVFGKRHRSHLYDTDSSSSSSRVVELCVMLSVSPASNPRETWTAEKQRNKGFDDAFAKRPAALYPFKRSQWFDVAFAGEPAVRAAPVFGSLPSHFRD